MQRVLLIEDLSLLNQISVTAALPILTATGLRPATLPTAILSTQSEGFGPPAELATANFLPAVVKHWQERGVRFAGTLVGYPGDLAILRQLPAILRSLPAPVCLVDPVLGDHGEYYPGLGATTRASFLPVARLATVLTPNWTELGLLAEMAWTAEPTKGELLAAAERLRQIGITTPLVVTSLHQGEETGCCVIVAGHCHFIGQPTIPGHFTGAGDVFAALLLAELVAGQDLLVAVERAQAHLQVAIAATAQLPVAERWDGLSLQPLLHVLTEREKKENEN